MARATVPATTWLVRAGASARAEARAKATTKARQREGGPHLLGGSGVWGCPASRGAQSAKEEDTAVSRLGACRAPWNGCQAGVLSWELGPSGTSVLQDVPTSYMPLL